ncbi:MAG: glutamine--fructose-6-phosphate transaminase (isomerizing) [Pseudomonadales bacterium]|jgi:glucosamine--fructose-6-phosphate aminotransferase (isomerizing)|nr:glutamine--fructose-6-phosphate transaminase (isomerizing) [Pseudomonadales bacterium]
MCGIVGAIAQRPIAGILIEGLRRLEYRGYDSAGLAVLEPQTHTLRCLKTVGKVQALSDAEKAAPALGNIGIAHTRWATHGKPEQRNAHPQESSASIAVVHNGIIENFQELKNELCADGYEFVSDTDTEVAAHLIHKIWQQQQTDFFGCVRQAIARLSGAYGLAVINSEQPDTIIAARSGSPIVIGVGIGENFIASDPSALGQVTDRFIYLEEGDIAAVTRDSITIYNAERPVKREVQRLHLDNDEVLKGHYRHYMQKEIFEQPEVIKNTLQGRLSKTQVLEQSFGVAAQEFLDRTKSVQMVACGTSYHACMVAKFWIESIAGIPCQVDVASEFRYRKVLVPPDCLFVTISQSGETADTLAALRYAKTLGYGGFLAVCNVANSSLVRESDFTLLTFAGREIGVASTKAFTTQLTVLALLTLALAKRGGLSAEQEKQYVRDLNQLPAIISDTLALDEDIKQLSNDFDEKHHALFLGRGIEYPVAKEGALKLKEISYIHAEAYPAGELKHGPLALVDADMPVVVVAPNNELLEKLKSNLQEVSARGGQLYVFADREAGLQNNPGLKLLNVPHCSKFLEPIVYTIPLQLLAYHVAVQRGTDVDRPRNLAKSVTVE